MAFAAHAFPGSAAALPGRPVADHPRPGILSRLLAAIIASRRARAEAEVGRFIEAHGGRMTDDLEREISRRFGGPVQ
jgi:hypothetical protein